MAELPHRRYYSRHLVTAEALRGCVVAILGVGAIGSLVAEILGRNGVDLVVVDRDTLTIENLCRHTADPAYVGEPKAISLAATLRSRLPDEQTIRGIDVDILTLTDEDLSDLLIATGAAIVVGATGEDEVDVRLNRVCGELDLPLVIPGLFGADEDLLGEVLFVPWSVLRAAYACFECGRPMLSRPDPLPAQPGPIDDGLAIARIAATTVRAYLLPGSAEGRRLAERVARGATLTLVGGSGDTVRYAQPQTRADCRGCARHREFLRIRHALRNALEDPPAPVAPAPAAPPTRAPTPAPERSQPAAIAPASARTQSPRIAATVTRRVPRRAPGSAFVVALMVAAGITVASWAAACGQLTKVNPKAACNADTPVEVMRAIRAKSNLNKNDIASVLKGARGLLAVDAELNGWGGTAADALERAVERDPRSADAIAAVMKTVPESRRPRMANRFLESAVVRSIGAERAVELGLSVARTPRLLDAKGAILTNLGEPGAGLAWFEESLAERNDPEVLAHWGYAAKLHALDVWDADLGFRGHIALSEGLDAVKPELRERYREALSWPVPAA